MLLYSAVLSWHGWCWDLFQKSFCLLLLHWLQVNWAFYLIMFWFSQWLLVFSFSGSLFSVIQFSTNHCSLQSKSFRRCFYSSDTYCPQLERECAKFRALRALVPYVPCVHSRLTCPRVLHVLVPCVPLRFTCPRALRALVPCIPLRITCPRALRALEPYVQS